MISIITPNYNKAVFLSETIKSVLSQTYTNWELLVVDDDSTDNSLSVIDEFVKKDKRIQLFKNDTGNKGGSVCRNIGLQKAQGAYVVFLDSDDLLAKRCLDSRIAEMTKNPSLDFAVFSMGTFFKSLGDSSSVWSDFRGDILNRFLSHDLPWAIPCPIWKRDFLIKLGGFNESFKRLQDVELHTRALLDESVNYEVYDFEPDCFYRIEESRIEPDYLSFMQRRLAGTTTYIAYFTSILEGKHSSRVKYLKGTFFSLLSQFFVAFSMQKINKKELSVLLNDFLEDRGVLFLLSRKEQKLVGFYIALKQKNISFKGMNYFVSKILLR